MGDPPFAGTVQVILAFVLPGIAATFVGVPGTTAAAEGVTVTPPEGKPLLMSFTARTNTV